MKHFSGLPESVFELVRAADELNARRAAEASPGEPPAELVEPAPAPASSVDLAPVTEPGHPDPAPLTPAFDAAELARSIRGPRQ